MSRCRRGSSSASWAMRWVASLDNCKVILSGMTTEEQVEDVYGDMSLKEALADRKASVGRMIDIIGKIINK